MPTSGLPTARHHFPPGTDRATCVDYNRALKAVRIAEAALQLGFGPYATDAQLDDAADAADVNRPSGDETRDAARSCLQRALSADVAPRFVINRVHAAAEQGHPFPYTRLDGITVLLVPIPMGESPSA
ncbi:hypothetical protein ACWCPS_36140 [Streptomyces mauvecolor]